MRFFKYLEKTLVPMLGVGLFICTVILVGWAMPSLARKAYLNRATFSPEHQVRLDGQTRKGPASPTQLSAWRLASADGLQRGLEVLLDQCVQCHDLTRRPSQTAHTGQLVLHRQAHGQSLGFYRPDRR